MNNVGLVAKPAEHSAGGYGFHDVISGNPFSTPAVNYMAVSIQYSQWGTNTNNTPQVGTPASSDYQAQVGTPASEDYQPQVDADGNPDYSVPPLAGTPASDNYQAAVRYIPTIGFKSYALEYGTGIDADGDGTLDRVDAFPDDSTETVDTDGDGFGDNSDEHNGFNDGEINAALDTTSADSKINLSAWLATNSYTVDDGTSGGISQSVYDAAVAAKATAETALANAREARPGSTVIDVANDLADITLRVEQTSDVSDWSSATTSDHTIQLSAPSGASFYRFTIPE